MAHSGNPLQYSPTSMPRATAKATRSMGAHAKSMSTDAGEWVDVVLLLMRMQNYKFFLYFCILKFIIMAEHNITGRNGEDIAANYLQEQGFAILERNWKMGKNEVDIIAYKEGLIVFAEVKTRSNLEFGDPEEFVGREKQRYYVRLANAYVIKNEREEEVRFDIIAIEMTESSYRVNHIENAFSAVGQYL